MSLLENSGELENSDMNEEESSQAAAAMDYKTHVVVEGLTVMIDRTILIPGLHTDVLSCPPRVLCRSYLILAKYPLGTPADILSLPFSVSG